MSSRPKLQVIGNAGRNLLKSSEQLRHFTTSGASGFIFKFLVAGAAISYIIHKVWSGFVDQAILDVFLGRLSPIAIGAMALGMAILMIANWGIEVIKWKELLSREYPIRWRRAIKSILSGTTFGVFSPNRSGEFVGRVLALPPEQRMKGAVLSFVNGLAQTLATYTYGILGIILLLEEFGQPLLNVVSIRILQIVLVLTIVILMTLYLNFRIFARYLSSIKLIRERARYVNVLKRADRSTLVRLYNWSMLRFAVFLAQYWLVFNWMGIQHDVAGILQASILSLFSSTLVPFLPIPDLLVRESVALSYFELYGFEAVPVSAAVLFIWLFNIAMPAVIGAVVLFTYRIFRR